MIGRAISQCEVWRLDFGANASQTGGRSRKAAVNWTGGVRKRMSGARAEGLNGALGENRFKAGQTAPADRLEK